LRSGQAGEKAIEQADRYLQVLRQGGRQPEVRTCEGMDDVRRSGRALAWRMVHRRHRGATCHRICRAPSRRTISELSNDLRSVSDAKTSPILAAMAGIGTITIAARARSPRPEKAMRRSRNRDLLHLSPSPQSTNPKQQHSLTCVHLVPDRADASKIHLLDRRGYGPLSAGSQGATLSARVLGLVADRHSEYFRNA
jgi:hypothetical protein